MPSCFFRLPSIFLIQLGHVNISVWRSVFILITSSYDFWDAYPFLHLLLYCESLSKKLTCVNIAPIKKNCGNSTVLSRYFYIGSARQSSSCVRRHFLFHAYLLTLLLILYRIYDH